MRSLSVGWICGLLLCCAVTAVGQNVSGSVSAEDSAGSESSVSASVSGVSEAQVSAGWNRGGAGRSVPTSAGPHSAVTATQQKKLSTFAHAGMASSPEYLSSRSAAKKMAAASLRASPEFSKIAKITLGSQRTERGSLISAAQGSLTSSQEVAATGEREEAETDDFSAGFPDSTRETGIVNPSDGGTTSPLDWTPGLFFGFADLTEVNFLNPSLHMQAPFTKKLQAARVRRLRLLRESSDDQSPIRKSTDLDPLKSLEPGILRSVEPDPLKSLEPGILDNGLSGSSSLHTTLDGQIGQQ